MTARRLPGFALLGLLLYAMSATSAQAADLTRGGFDLRAGTARASVSSDARAARRDLRADLGARALVSIDRATGRPRVVGRLDGALTGPSGDTGAEIASRFLRAHAAAYGLTSAQIAGLEVGAQRRSAGGLVSVQLTQSHGGVTSIDSGVRAVLDARGRLIELVGAPDPDLATAGTQRAVSRERAATIAAEASGAPGRAAGARVSAVIFHIGPAARQGWRVLVAAGPRQTDDVLVDATSGAVVRRANRVVAANAASVYEAWPGAPLGGTAAAVDLAPYLDNPAAPTKLKGPNAHAFTDAKDLVPGFFGFNVVPAAGSDVGPSSGTDFDYPLHGLTLGPLNCPTAGATCAWDPETPNSWVANREQDAVQLFWLVNEFHDHLAAAPIGFDAADGNFEGDDPILAQSLDGADTSGGLPDLLHLDNANFLPLPDGIPGSMQMYLFGGADDPFFGPDPFFSVSGSDDASIVYHEYAHGLSNRLVTEPGGGFGALNTLQAGAMGEAWSDWYAFDKLARDGNLADVPGVADVRTGAYVEGTQDLIRTEPIDCPAGTEDPACPGSPTAGPGGYTFGDLGQVLGFPEVHADGEIWSQTLWQLRDALIAAHGAVAGTARAEQLVTDAMRLSPPEPSFLDQRNAILQADAVDAPAGQDADTIWAVFASRGMGWFASIESSSQVRALEDFSLPPAPAAGSATVQGVVRSETGGLEGVPVGFTGHDTGIGPDLTAISDAAGAYVIADVPAGTYPKLRALLPASYVGGIATGLTVPATGTLARDLVARRNWASGPGGAAIRSFTGPDYGFFGCGPAQAIDDDPTTGWSTDVGGSKQFVVELPADTTISGIAIDPSPACGDPADAQVAGYRVKVARDDEGDPGAFTTAAGGTFGPADLGAAHDVALAGPIAGVRYVQVQALTNNGNPFYMDISEVHVFGHATTPAEGGGGTAAPEVTTLAADAAATTASSATFRAAVTPHGAATVVRIAFGLASGQSSYQTVDVPVVGNAPQTLAITAGGLLPNTTYHYRAVATNSRATVTGNELTVTTAPAAVPEQAPKGDPGPAGPAGTPGTGTPPPAGTPKVVPAVTCALRGRRAVTCTFTARAGRTDGTRARLSRRGVIYARGTVHGRVLRMRATRDVRRATNVLTITRGRGSAAIVKRFSVKL